MPLSFSAAPPPSVGTLAPPARHTERSKELSAGPWAGSSPDGSEGPGPLASTCRAGSRTPPGGTCGGGSTGPAVRSLPTGLQGSRDFNWSLNQHSSASSPAWWGPLPPCPRPA